MTFERPAHSNDDVNRAIEVTIHVGLLILLAVACFLILRPFVPLITAGIIVAIAAYPAYRRLESFLSGRRTLAAVLWTLVLLTALILPIAWLTGTLVETFQTLTPRLKQGTLVIPPPPPTVATWPIIGTSLYRSWSLASTSLNSLLSSFAPQIKAAIASLLSASAEFASTVLQLVLALLVSGALLANAQGVGKITHSLANRLFGVLGPEFHQLIGATIRSVTVGILGVAVIQTVFAAIGFLVARLPSAGLWTTIFLIAAVLQVGVLVLIPAVIYAFSIMSTTKAVIFLIWCVIVGLMDNLLKPLLLGRGVAVPIAVVFLGAIGGFIAMGIIGLFVGATLISVGYKLFLAWLKKPVADSAT